MTTFAIIGAGPGLGAAVARRFGREGFRVALISRTQENLDALVADLTAAGVPAAAFAADVRDPEALQTALRAAAEDLGPIEVLQYSPVPHRDFLKPLDDTTRDDLRAAFEFAVLGPQTAVTTVVAGMREQGKGTVVFVNGGSAVTPNPGVTGTSVAFAAESAYARLLHDQLAPEGVHVAQLIVPGAIAPGDPHHAPDVLADRIWGVHTDRAGFRHTAGPGSGDCSRPTRSRARSA